MSPADRFSDFPEAPASSAGVSSYLVPPSAENFERLAQQLREGRLVAIPTETVYGLAADASNPDACSAIFRLKGRPLLDPLIVHVRDLATAQEVAHFNPLALHLAEACWPGALTMVLPKTDLVPPIVTAGLDTVAVRCPAHPDFRELAARTGTPLAAPSANPFGYISPTRAEHVLRLFPEANLPILDGGPCAIGLESTIIDLSDPNRPRVLRSGHFTTDQLAKVLGCPVAAPGTVHTETGPMPAPGMLSRHYSPKTPAKLVEELPSAEIISTAVARVFFMRPPETRANGDFWLSENGDSEIANRALYSLLHHLDADDRWNSILIEVPPLRADTEALRDRLRRACSQG